MNRKDAQQRSGHVAIVELHTLRAGKGGPILAGMAEVTLIGPGKPQEQMYQPAQNQDLETPGALAALVFSPESPFPQEVKAAVLAVPSPQKRDEIAAFTASNVLSGGMTFLMTEEGPEKCSLCISTDCPIRVVPLGTIVG